MNATRAAWPEYRTESPAYRKERPTQFRPDLRVVHHTGVPAGHARPSVPDSAPGSIPAPIPAADALSSVVLPHVQDYPAIEPITLPRPAPAPLVSAWHLAPPSSKASPLRLTRRGRIVVAVMAAFLVAGLSLAVAGAAQATGHFTSSRSGSPNLTRVVVRPGQTLWSVAQTADPNADPRQIIQQIAQLNALTSETLAVGQRLWVPRS
jgi:nucleoid-associated protein YgaU